MRALVVGPPLKVGRIPGVDVIRSPSFFNSPNMTDFHILVIQYSKDRVARGDSGVKRDELQSFLSAGGFCLVIPLDPSMNGSGKVWCPTALPTLVSRDGTLTRWDTDSPVARSMQNYRYEWNCYVSPGYEGEIRPLAWNNADQVVAFGVRSGLGEIALFPRPKTARMLEKVVRSQVRMAAERIAERSMPVAPKWSAGYGGDVEQRLHANVKEAEAVLTQFLKVKSCLYATGAALTDSVVTGLRQILSPLGFLVEDQERKGGQDIIASSDALELRLECKGLKGYAKVGDVRQLHDYCTRRASPKPIKGVLVVNHFRNNAPDKRGDVATPDAISLATSQRYCIIPTTVLFETYLAVMDGKLTREMFLQKLDATVGLLNRA